MTITRTEAKLFVRDPLALFFGLVFPALLLLALGYLFPGFDEPAAELDGARYIDIYSPIVIGLGLATLGLVTLPPILAGYRQFGILKRLRTTPVHPARLLAAQLAVHLATAVAATGLAVLVPVLAFDVIAPKNVALLLVAFVVGAASVFSVGLLVGALARTAASGQALGMAIYFPMLFLAGVWIPRSIMPDGLRLISDMTPLGAAVQALNDAWRDGSMRVGHLLVMVVYSVVVSLVATKVFRWE